MKNDEETKCFADLLTDIQAAGLCGRCGGCVSFCSAGEFNAIRMGRDGMPEWVDEKKCVKCGICYLICPQVKVLDAELRKRFGWRSPAGSYRMLTSARTARMKVAPQATDGGVVTSMLLYALEKKLIDGAVVSHKTGPFICEPFVATTADEIIRAAGSSFDKTANLGEIGRSYTSFVPVIREVGRLRQRQLTRVALVGTPCQVYSLRKMQALKVLPSDAVALVIGLFCMENFSFTRAARKKLESRLGVKIDNVNRLNIKDDVILHLKGESTLHVPFEVMDEIARPACFSCTDFANDFADISCGGLGSPDGYTTVMVRTTAGERIYNGALQRGFIREMSFSGREQARLHRTTQAAKIVSFALRKRERAARKNGGAVHA